MGATILAFLPALQGGFVDWDDPANFLENPAYRGLSPRHLAWMFTTFHMGPYQPLAWVTLGLDYLLWGMDARGYHLTSVLLHAATALAFYCVSLRLLGLALGDRAGPWDLRVGAAAAALLFAVHPLRAESVAWITERRDVLSGLFYMLALLAWLRWAAPAATGDRERGAARWYWCALGLYAAALASKATAVTLLAVLLILDAYPLRRLRGIPGRAHGRVWLEKAPFAALGVAAAVAAFVGVSRGAHLTSLDQLAIPARLVLAVYAVAFYAVATVAPMGLAPLAQFPVTVSWFHFALVALLSAAAVGLPRRWPAWSAVWAAYLSTVLPVAGLFHSGPQSVADRYSYLACLGFALLGGGVAAFRWRCTALVRIALAGVVGLLGVLTWHQAAVWQDPITLWSQVARVNPESRAAHAFLGKAYEERGRIPEAAAHYTELLRLSRHQAPAHLWLGQLWERAGHPAEAAAHFRDALRLQPDLAEACAGLARLLPGAAAGAPGAERCPPGQ